MKTALDTSVILDVLTGDARWSDASETALKEAQSLGQLVIGECVMAEITLALAENELGHSHNWLTIPCNQTNLAT